MRQLPMNKPFKQRCFCGSTVPTRGFGYVPSSDMLKKGRRRRVRALVKLTIKRKYEENKDEYDVKRRDMKDELDVKRKDMKDAKLGKLISSSMKMFDKLD
ncbi:15082_t:CDS:2 [Cetraspora pellucida]|uniref:15082_t:CDS:1 n=1 Tax=Cetraspora pellucida TaxID=1433469 RepID=A0A9N8WQ62_9GLOM|nr:15082_t:CDS:2 [Cetraspora pellucida]